ncbi:MAG: mechanosensitive ion channel domain-containing protein [Nanobdellota archaeon]
MSTINQLVSNSVVINITLGIIIFISSLILGKVVEKVLSTVLKKSRLEKVIEKSTSIKINIDKIISSLVAYLIYFFGVIMALTQIGIATTILNLLSGMILILVIIVIFLAFKDFIPNAAAGLLIHSKGFINEGDKIKIHDIEGKIIYLNLVETRVKTRKGDIIYIPNSRLTRYEVVKRKK